jgi:hypothetical protein
MTLEQNKREDQIQQNMYLYSEDTVDTDSYKGVEAAYIRAWKLKHSSLYIVHLQGSQHSAGAKGVWGFGPNSYSGHR